jgi:hypothetical protein
MDKHVFLHLVLAPDKPFLYRIHLNYLFVLTFLICIYRLQFI